jgi:hypothetical protein
MSNEYIIVNKSAIQKIDELVKEANAGKTISSTNSQMAESLIRFKEQLLSQSTPLIPEIDKAWEDGRDGTKVVGSFPFIETHYINKTSQDYISNLKLDI